MVQKPLMAPGVPGYIPPGMPGHVEQEAEQGKAQAALLQVTGMAPTVSFTAVESRQKVGLERACVLRNAGERIQYGALREAA
jgi:hypothetical protein